MREALVLPEVRWTFRRYYSYGLTVLLAGLVGLVIWRTEDPRALMWLGLSLVAVIAIVALLYLAGATATDITRLTAAVRGDQEHHS